MGLKWVGSAHWDSIPTNVSLDEGWGGSGIGVLRRVQMKPNNYLSVVIQERITEVFFR